MQNEAEAPHTLADIVHSFEIMEEYVIYDANKTMTFDLASAVRNPDISLLDIRIALDFADHGNDIMNAVIGPTGKVNELQTRDELVSDAIDELENGKFSALFGESGPVGNVNDVMPTSYISMRAPIISALGVDEYNNIHETRRDGSGPTLVCGGSFTQPHPPATRTTSGNFATESAAVLFLIATGYHPVAPICKPELSSRLCQSNRCVQL